jgi:signal transduction histidine kinase
MGVAPLLTMALERTAAAVAVAFGTVALGCSSIGEPAARRRLLYRFAYAHLLLGALALIQWIAILGPAVSPWIAWAPLSVGLVLLYTAVTGPTLEPVRRSFTLLGGHDVGGRVRVDHGVRGLGELRSQYEEHIRRAAQREERARLARELHDAVKQQLFVIQTAAATAETRYGADEPGARTALGQVRASAREATTEMEALIEGLQATPADYAGFVGALRKQCEALGYRTGATVTVDVGALPRHARVEPGTYDALFRATQEGLANIGRHARAAHVAITFGLIDEALEVAIRDDGAGFDPVATREGMGLRNMAARVAAVGGACIVQSSRGAGTSIRLTVPCRIESPDRYLRRAAIYAVPLTLMIVWLAPFWDAAERPWYLALIAIFAIAVGRCLTAYGRVRKLEGASA